MSNKEKDEKLSLTEQLHAFRIEDWWGTHNITSRLLAICIAFVMVVSVIAFLMGSPIPSEVLVASIWASASVVIIITVGANSLDSIADIISKIKGFK